MSTYICIPVRPKNPLPIRHKKCYNVMMFFKIHTNERASDWLKALLIVSSCGAIAVLITYVLYGFTQDLLVERLRERLTAIVSTASLRFSAEDVESISSYEDSNKPAFAKIVEQLDELRSANKNLQYAYIMRRTDDPNTFEFVADADSLSLLEDIDENGNGILDEEEQPPMPGDPYDVSEYPVLRDEAFYYPVAEHELASDQWGSLLAAFAPIRDSSGNTVAILGVDVIVTDFMQVTRATLMPFLLFVLFLILMLALLSLMLLRINRERIKALQEIDRQKDELISIVSHQLNTPVSAVKWNIEMFLDGDLGKMSDEQTKQLNLMQSELASLADLVSMLLDVSRIQLGRMKVSRAELDLAAFFAEELAVIEPKAKEKKVKFTAHIPAKLPVGYLDKRLVRMTLENLLTNAVKYTPEGGQASLTVKLQGDKIIYEVKDTGCGIPKAEQARMFEKLFRASNVVNAQEGNGLGMFVAKGAVEAQGGSIRFESEEGKGSVFYVELPLIKKAQTKSD